MNIWTKTKSIFRVKVEVAGKTESDVEQALEEALRKVKEGYLSGGDSNDTGAYQFNVDSPDR